MARGVNKVILVGTCGQDPDVRYLPSGNAVTNLSLATSEQWNDKQTGQRVEKTEWHRVVMFGKVAEIAGEYVRKGSQIYIEGKLQTREWEKDGVKRYSTEIVVDVQGTMQLLGSRNNNSAEQRNTTTARPNPNSAAAASHTTSPAAPTHQEQRPAQAIPAQPMNNFDNFDDDIPF